MAVLRIGLLTILFMAVLSNWVVAGDLEPPGPPGPTMHTLDEIYTVVTDTNSKVTGVAPGTCVAGAEKTGQTTTYAVGDDGNIEPGVIWPNPRFTDSGNGTVTDNMTSLTWTKNANCLSYTRNWSQCLEYCNSLASGLCGLNDGSTAGNWRLPNRNELMSLLHLGYYNPALPNGSGTAQWEAGDPFDITPGYFLFWSSTTFASGTGSAWYVDTGSGGTYPSNKGSGHFCWCVRGGPN